MKKETYLLELGCEEIPARFMPGLLKDLKTKLSAALDKQNVAYKAVEVLGTYRRVVARVLDLQTVLPSSEETIKGPPARIALDQNGNFTKAALGFAKKNNVSPEALTKKEINGETYIFVSLKRAEKKVSDVLADLIPSTVMSLNQPVGMRWGSETKTFIRPIHWIVSLFGKDIVPFELFGIAAENVTYGHRFLSKASKNQGNQTNGKSCVVSHADKLEDVLTKQSVILNQDERLQMIQDFVVKHGGQVDDYKGLLSEVSYLVESPAPIVGIFSKSFLELPEEVLIQCMTKHQKYFPVIKGKSLANTFICIADNLTTSNKETIVLNNQKVLGARLKDVEFFWHEDLKRPISTRVDDLKPVLFQEGLGSIYNKLERHQKLAAVILKQLAWHGFIKGLNKKDLEQSIWLSKADLTTEMVGEHPSLQGRIGNVYANKEGLPNHVCEAIEEHYLPKFEGDRVSQNVYAVISALADKIDTIVACFTNNLIPTGSQDPWGIRRHVFGVYAIVLEHNLPLNVLDLVNTAYENFEKQNNRDKLLPFVEQRIKSFLGGRDYSHDVIDACSKFMLEQPLYGALWMDLVSDSASVKQVSEMVTRVKNLAKKCKDTAFSVDDFTSKYETNAFKKFSAFCEALPTLKTPEKVFKAGQGLTNAFSEYFEHVMVMDSDPLIQANRLGFLGSVKTVFEDAFPDFDALV